MAMTLSNNTPNDRIGKLLIRRPSPFSPTFQEHDTCDDVATQIDTIIGVVPLI